MNKEEQILAKKIISNLIGDSYMPSQIVLSLNEIFLLMQEYHAAKIKEVTDEDIEVWANDSHISMCIGALQLGAEAFRDGKIKHND